MSQAFIDYWQVQVSTLMLQASITRQARSDLYDAAQNDECWNLVGAGSADEARRSINQAGILPSPVGSVTVTITPPPPDSDPNTAPSNVEVNWQYAKTAGGTIHVGPVLFFSPGAQVWDVGGEQMSFLEIMAKSGYPSLTERQLRIVALVHELSHINGRPNDVGDRAAARDFDTAAAYACAGVEKQP